MNPLLKHTLEELSNHNSDPAFVIGEAFTSLLKQANENPRLNLCGGDSIDENTARPIQKKSLFEIPDHLSDYMPDIPPISNVMTCRNRMLQGKRLPNCAEICSRGFDKVPKLKRECEIPDCWL